LEQPDVVLCERFKNERPDGAPNSGPMLTEKAEALYIKMQLAEENYDSGNFLVTDMRALQILM
jgi:hypothetical protein